MTTANVTPTLMFSRVPCGVLCAVRRQVLLNSATGKPLGLDRLALHAVDVVTLENNSYVQVSINKVITYLLHVCPNATAVQLVNCIAW
jgi:hypothetical protein